MYVKQTAKYPPPMEPALGLRGVGLCRREVCPLLRQIRLRVRLRPRARRYYRPSSPRCAALWDPDSSNHRKIPNTDTCVWNSIHSSDKTHALSLIPPSAAPDL